MQRRQFITGLVAGGTVTTAGCGAVASGTTLADPTVKTDAPGRRSIHFTENGEEIGHLGVDGTVTDGLIELDTEIWHREGTYVESISLRVWMPDADDTPARVAVVSPVEGDSSPPPSLSLYSPARAPGTVIEITDIDDLADETISTLDLVVRPGSGTATKLTIDARMELTDPDFLGTDYTLDGRLELSYPELTA